MHQHDGTHINRQNVILAEATHRMWEMSRDAYMDVGGTIPWMESVESSLERRPREKHDSKDGGARATPGAVAEVETRLEQRSRSQYRGQDVRSDQYPI